MSAENHHEPGPQNPEQTEWQGQRWEYLALRVLGNSAKFLAVPKWDKGFFASEIEADIVASDYNQKMEEIVNQERITTNLIIALRIAGDDGWELIASVFHQEAVVLDNVNLLILKRPFIAQK